MAIISLLILIIAPIYLIRASRQHLADSDYALVYRTEEAEKKIRHAKIFADYRPQTSALLYVNIFFTRRFLLLIILIFLPMYTLSQIGAQLLCTMIVLLYIASQRPYKSSFMNKLEILNELTIFVAVYPLLAFTEWVWDLDTRMDIGWSLVGLIGLNIISNILVVLTIFIHTCYRGIRLRCVRKRRKKQALKALRERQEKMQIQMPSSSSNNLKYQAKQEEDLPVQSLNQLIDSDKERKDVSRITVKPNLNYFSGPDPKDPEAIQQRMVEAKFSMPVVRQTDSILKKDKAE